jgi:hypothetical protein
MSSTQLTTTTTHVNGSRTVAELSWDEFASGTLPESPARKAWREAVIEVGERAKAKLPQCASRITSAVKIVLAGDVDPQTDGTAQVRSQQGGKTVYHVANGSCTCADFRKALEGWCKHRIAHAIYRRARAQVAQQLQALEALPTTPQQPQEAPIAPPVDSQSPPADPQAWMTGSSKHWKVTEAPLSTCLKLRIGVVEWTHTVRAQTDSELRGRLDDFRQLVADMTREFATLAVHLERKHQELRSLTNTPKDTPPQQSDAPDTTDQAPHGPAEGWCPIHDVEMTRSKDGQSYYHKVGEKPDGKAVWCRGK